MITWVSAFLTGVALVIWLLSPRAAFAETRIALVIGNGAYEHAPLDNPPRDADLMAGALRRLNFEVTIEKDLDQREMNKLIGAFGKNLKEDSNTIGFFYYSGHGMQVDGRNYMIPVDATIEDEPDVQIYGVLADGILTRMEYAGAKINIVVLDACRNNPFEKRFKSPQEGIGLAAMQAPAGTLVAYATAPGDVAEPGPKGGYSPFTETLAEELRTSDASLLEVFNAVSAKVYDRTEQDQRPYVEFSAVPSFSFVRPAAQATVRQRPEQATPPLQPAVGVYEQPSQYQAGDEFRDCDDCPLMVVIRAGSFTMGSSPGEAERDSDEGPQHRVTIARRFAVGKYEVTFDEWDACVADGGCSGYKPDDLGWGRGRQPVINVSWDDAQAYVAWLSQETGQPYRLPSEAEWEYACRAETATSFWTGSTISTAQANYDGNYTYGGGQKGEYRRQTTPVDEFAPNPWGLHDMHGNVWEQVEDCWNDSYEGAPSDGSAWTSGDCGRRVSRGGSWYFSPDYLRSASRARDDTDLRGDGSGFRVARTLSRSES